ncbi:MAG: ATP-binding protein [Mycobacteriales bacterium]
MGNASITRPVLACLAAGLLATAVIAAVGTVAQRRAAVAEAVSGARQVTTVLARDVVAPALTDQALRGGAAAEPLDRLVHQHVLSGDVVRVKVWAADGTVLYSDRTALEGRRFHLGAREQRALRAGTAVAELSDLRAPENTGERSYGTLLEVYLGVRTTSGRPVLFETYQRYDRVVGDSRRTLARFLPALLGGLGLLFLLQVPLVTSLARRVRHGHERESALLRQALDASDDERRRIASDLHDGVVQGLAGVSYTLSATAQRVGGDEGQSLRTVAASLRQWVRELRTLVLDITPPTLHEEGLPTALTDLLSGLQAQGVAVSLATQLTERPARDVEALVFRVAQEAVRNISRHAAATHVEAELCCQATGTRLRLTDDGRGFAEPERAARRAKGHVGLDLLTDLARAHGGTLQVSSAPGTGTTLVLEVP